MNNPNPFYVEMGERIISCRKSLNLSQDQLAEQAGVSTQAVSTAERGIKALRPDNLLKISRVLGVSADYLLSGEMNNDSLPFAAERMKSLSSEQVQEITSIINACLNLCKKE